MQNEKLVKSILDKGILLIVIIFTLYLFSTLLLPQNLGTNEVIKEYHSPNKKYKAIVFLRHYNSITDSTVNVSVIDTSKSLKNKKGNVFIATMPNLSSNCIDIKWNTPNEIEVLRFANLKVIKSKSNVEDISIKYY